MSFEVEHAKWIKEHLSRRNSERKDALKRGHGFRNRMFAEKIWWALLGHFGDLHPEYEVMDWRGRSYFVDFVWKVRGKRFAIEIVDDGSQGKDRSYLSKAHKQNVSASQPFCNSEHCWLFASASAPTYLT